MKKTIVILFVIISAVCFGQFKVYTKDTTFTDGCNTTTCVNGSCMTTTLACATFVMSELDSFTAERFFEDSVGGTYMVEYRVALGKIADDTASHSHYIAMCSVIKYKGNRKQIIFANYKSIYSPTECSSDSRELWLKRLYLYQNRK